MIRSIDHNHLLYWYEHFRCGIVFIRPRLDSTKDVEGVQSEEDMRKKGEGKSEKSRYKELGYYCLLNIASSRVIFAHDMSLFTSTCLSNLRHGALVFKPGEAGPPHKHSTHKSHS